MNKLLIASLMAASLLAACGKSEDAKPTDPAAKQAAPAAEAKKDAKSAPADTAKPNQVAPTVVAPKPPPPPGGKPAAPELKPEDIARIQEMLKKQAAEPKEAKPADAAKAKK